MRNQPQTDNASERFIFAEKQILRDAVKESSLFSEELDALENEESTTDTHQNFLHLKQQQDIADQKSARELRKGYADKTFRLVAACLVFWAAVTLVLMVWNIRHGRAPLDDKGFITFTAGITANIFSAYLGVIRGVFRIGREHKE